jgi:hypothetical protein
MHAADVAHGGARLHGAERDDLRDVLAAVLLGDVGDDFAAPALAEVDVDIRQRDALRVEEALEVQIEVQRIDVRDPERSTRPGCPPTIRGRVRPESRCPRAYG